MFKFSLWCRNWVCLPPTRTEGWGTGNCYSPSGEIGMKRRGKTYLLSRDFFTPLKSLLVGLLEPKYLALGTLTTLFHFHEPKWLKRRPRQTSYHWLIVHWPWVAEESFFYKSFTVLSERRCRTREYLRLSLMEDFSRIYRLLEKIKFPRVPIRRNWEDHAELDQTEEVEIEKTTQSLIKLKK